MPTPDELVRQQYGFMAWALDIPEIGNILRNAAAGGWDEARLKGAIQGTNWWKSTNESQRAFDQTLAEDKATAMQRVAQQKANLLAIAQQSGIAIDSKRLDWLALQSVRDGWTQQQLRSSIGNEFKYVDNKQQAGTAGALQRKFAEMAREYGVPWSNDLSKWFVTSAQGQDPEAASETVRGYLIEQAKSRFPYIGKQLDAGMTTKQYMSPYIQDAARILERAPESIDLNDQMMTRVMGQMVDPKTGEKGVMSMAQAQDYFRSLPEYTRTKGAMEQASNLAGFIGQRFGVSA